MNTLKINIRLINAAYLAFKFRFLIKEYLIKNLYNNDCDQFCI